jgi:hypothetical protein
MLNIGVVISTNTGAGRHVQMVASAAGGHTDTLVAALIVHTLLTLQTVVHEQETLVHICTGMKVKHNSLICISRILFVFCLNRFTTRACTHTPTHCMSAAFHEKPVEHTH